MYNCINTYIRWLVIWPRKFAMWIGYFLNSKYKNRPSVHTYIHTCSTYHWIFSLYFQIFFEFLTLMVGIVTNTGTNLAKTSHVNLFTGTGTYLWWCHIFHWLRGNYTSPQCNHMVIFEWGHHVTQSTHSQACNKGCHRWINLMNSWFVCTRHEQKSWTPYAACVTWNMMGIRIQLVMIILLVALVLTASKMWTMPSLSKTVLQCEIPWLSF